MVFALGDLSGTRRRSPAVGRQNLSDQVLVTVRFLAVHGIPQQADAIGTRDGASAGFRNFYTDILGVHPAPGPSTFAHLPWLFP